jgi:hypothetical protein
LFQVSRREVRRRSSEQREDGPEYFWLCSDCASKRTLAINVKGEVETILWPREGNISRPALLAAHHILVPVS